MPYWYGKNTPADSSNRTKPPIVSGFRNIRYALDYAKTIVVTQADVGNLPGISYREYGTESAFHAILAYNGLTDPLTDLYPGVRLRLFTKASLDAYLSEQRKRKPRQRSRIVSV